MLARFSCPERISFARQEGFPGLCGGASQIETFEHDRLIEQRRRETRLATQGPLGGYQAQDQLVGFSVCARKIEVDRGEIAERPTQPRLEFGGGSEQRDRIARPPGREGDERALAIPSGSLLASRRQDAARQPVCQRPKGSTLARLGPLQWSLRPADTRQAPTSGAHHTQRAGKCRP